MIPQSSEKKEFFEKSHVKNVSFEKAGWNFKVMFFDRVVVGVT